MLQEMAALVRRASRLYARVKEVDFLKIFSLQQTRRRSRPTSFQEFLRITLQSEWMAVSILRIADAIMFNGWKIVDKRTKKPIEDPDAPVVSIFTTPNLASTWHQFIEELVWFWMATGNAFIWKRRSAEGTAPFQLWLLDPVRVTVVPDPVNFISHYELLASTGNKNARFELEVIEHVRFGNPFDPYLGLGRVEANPRMYRVDDAAASYAENFFENDASPGLVLQTAGRLHPSTLNHLKEQFEEQHKGHRRSHGLSILEEGLTIEKGLTSMPREAQFLETRKTIRESILGVMGVQPLQAGITEGANRATAFVQMRLFQKHTIAPLLKRLQLNFSKIAANFGPFAFVFDEMVQEDNLEDAQIAQQYFAVGAITPNEIRVIYAGLPKVENNPAMDDFYFQGGLFKVGEEQAIPFGASTEGDTPAEPGAELPELPAEPEAKAPQGTPLQQRVLRHYRIRQASQTVNIRMQVRRFFRSQGDAVIKRLLTGEARSFTKGVDDIFNTEQDDRIWRQTMRSIFTGTVLEEFTLTSRLMGLEDRPGRLPFEPGEANFEQRIDRLASKVTRVSQATKERLDVVVAEGIRLGLNPSAIANGAPDQGYAGIRGIFEGEFAQNRAQLIARTESAKALEQANTAVYKGLGVTVCDVIGCEDSEIVPGQKWGCNSRGIPIDEAAMIEFHPNHKGAIVPRVSKAADIQVIMASMLPGPKKSKPKA
ncbi:hypothetical protein LCGC14_0441200 [marine sediment metagenome]|uniref:Phage portal protein n=1 Tax=marine sediment metagenome TaxID=412755 RepID=A0A0F9VUI3_9ZZZZ